MYRNGTVGTISAPRIRTILAALAMFVTAEPGAGAGADAAAAQTTTTLAQAATAPSAEPDPTPEAELEPQFPAENRYEARQSEARLTRAERAELQVALQWAGHYKGAIDAAFGPGTRGAMAAWQRQNGYEPTGILTIRQRAELLRQYNAVLDGMGLRLVEDRKAGIAIRLPMGALTFDEYAFPFARYAASGESPAQVLLISQRGGRDTLAGLYDIMQTLNIVPPQGPRSLKRDGFTLTGADSRRVSHTQVWLRGSEIKGFTLVWPAGDEARRTRILEEMQDSFARLPGVLDPTETAAPVTRPDLVAGLQVRTPRLTHSGFFVGESGAVLTTRAVTRDCSRITIGDEREMRVAASDDDLGAALLRPVQPLAPGRVARLRDTPVAPGTRVAVAGFSYGGMLGAPTMTFGDLADTRGLSGEEDLARLTLSALDGDAGGPVLDLTGAVIGMLLPRRDDDNRALPGDVAFAADAAALRALAERAGLQPVIAGDAAPRPAEKLTDAAAGFTVLVECWK